MERFLELKEVILLYQNTDAGESFFMSQEEWNLTKDLVELLAPAYETTLELGAEKSVTASIVIPTVKVFRSWYSQKEREHLEKDPNSIATKFASAMNENIAHRFRNCEQVDVLAISTICDPRWVSFMLSTDINKCYLVTSAYIYRV